MKIWLDDERTPPDRSWVWVRDAWSAIQLLDRTFVSSISLDHDLGDDEKHGTGYDVLCWLEEDTHGGTDYLPVIKIHTANPVGRRKMLVARERIKRNVV